MSTRWAEGPWVARFSRIGWGRLGFGHGIGGRLTDALGSQAASQEARVGRKVEFAQSQSGRGGERAQGAGGWGQKTGDRQVPRIVPRGETNLDFTFGLRNFDPGQVARGKRVLNFEPLAARVVNTNDFLPGVPWIRHGDLESAAAIAGGGNPARHAVSLEQLGAIPGDTKAEEENDVAIGRRRRYLGRYQTSMP
jgi:hypothetical protein